MIFIGTQQPLKDSNLDYISQKLWTDISNIFKVTVKTQERRQMMSLLKWLSFFNTFHANVPFLYFLNTSQNQTFSNVFMGYRNGTLT